MLSSKKSQEFFNSLCVDSIDSQRFLDSKTNAHAYLSPNVAPLYSSNAPEGAAKMSKRKHHQIEEHSPNNVSRFSEARGVDGAAVKVI